MQVRDLETEAPIPYATAMIRSTTQGALADDQGWMAWTAPVSRADTLVFSALGYERKVLVLGSDSLPRIVYMKRLAAELQEVVIRVSEPPGLQLMRKVWERRAQYDPNRWESYRRRSHTKIQLDMLNLSRKQFESLPVPFIRSLGFIYENQREDSLGNRRLPFFLTEALSVNYYGKQSFRQKEVVVASQMKGIDNASIRQFLGSHYLTVNPYDGYMNVINKRFLSPMTPLAEGAYQFEIRDTVREGKHSVIRVDYYPRNREQKLFEGQMHIVDSLYALQRFWGQIPATADLNWVSNGSVELDYGWVEDQRWMPVREQFKALVRLSGQIRLPSIHLTKTQLYGDYRFQDPSILDTLAQDDAGGELVLQQGNDQRDSLYWATHRMEELNEEEASIFHMYDTLETIGAYQRLKALAKILATGVWETGPIEWGPYWNLYSQNPIEGHRFRATIGTTPAFSKRLFLQTYLAYGTLDQSFKYQGSALFIIRKNPRIYLYAAHRDDLDASIQYYGRSGFDNLLNLAIRRPNIPWKLTRVKETQMEYLHGYVRGFSHKIQLLSKRFRPYEPLPTLSLLRDKDGAPSAELSVLELSLQLRYAFEERFVEGHYYRYSLGSKYPIIELDLGLGYQQGRWGAPYQKVRLNASDQIPVPPLGKLSLGVYAGKYFGALPYLLLENHPGNESYFYRRNTMNLFPHFTFLSDQYAGMFIEHNLEWSIFQYIPLLKKAKIRQFWNFKPMVGSLSPANQQINLDKGFPFQTLDAGPYIECGTGVENLFRVFRIDLVWQLSNYRSPAPLSSGRFGLLGSLRLDF